MGRFELLRAQFRRKKKYTQHARLCVVFLIIELGVVRPSHCTVMSATLSDQHQP